MAYPFTSPNVEYGLANQANQFMQQQATMPYLRGLPGYASMVGQRSLNTGNLLRGQVPTDVLQQIQQRGMERGVATGVRGDSPNANAAWMRALGLTSLGLQQQGSQQLSQSIADVPVPEIWNPLSLYVPERTAKAEFDVAQASATPGGLNNSNWFSQFLKPQSTQNRWTSPSGALV